MLIQYSVKNFLSFKEQATLSMVASKRKSKDHQLDEDATWSLTEDLKLLKCAVIYGANNSGKSNLIKSLHFLKQFILDSSKESRVNENIQVSPFLLNSETEHEPSSFEVIFVKEKYLYQYELSVSRERVESERLSRKALKKNAVTTELFSRTLNVIESKKGFKEGKGLEGRTRPNALFLSVCANFDGPIATSVLSWFSSVGIVSGLHDAAPLAWTASRLDNPEFGNSIQQLLKVFDLGIDRFEAGEQIPGIQIEAEQATLNEKSTAPEEVAALTAMISSLNRNPSRKVISYHKMYSEAGEVVRDVPFDLNTNESAGTRKLVALAGPIVLTLQTARVIVIDEFESRLHAKITGAILKMFNSQVGNPNGAQLIAATHDTNLLSGEHVRRDQVWFTGRDGLGCTSLRSLVEYRARNDASYEKNYLDGDYGGVPYLRPDIANIVARRERTSSK